MNTDQIQKKIRSIPPDIVPEVMDYIDFLISKYGAQDEREHEMTFKWQGGLSELSDQFDSVRLQHKVSEWR